MHFEFNWRSGLLLVFFVHGLVYALLLLNKGIKKETQSDFWLSAFLFFCILYICPWMLGYAGWYDGKSCMECRNFMFYMPMTHPLIMAPIIYFYIKSLLNPKFVFYKKDLLHFLPGILCIIWNIIVAVVDNLLLKKYYLMDGENDPDFQNWYIGLGLLSLLSYLLISLRYYKQYLAFIVNELSFADNVQFKWASNFLIACFIYFFSSLILHLLNLLGFSIEYTTAWWYYLLFALLFYYIAITGYSHSIVQKKKYSLDFNRYTMPPQLPNSSGSTTEDIVFELIQNPIELNAEPNNAIPEIWKIKVKEALEIKKLYQDPELTLTDLATELGTNASLLSKIINRSFGMNFNDYINQYRVMEVKLKLENPANSNLTIMSLAYDAGFNSKATFNRAFKKHTGENPKTYQIKV